MSQHSVPPRWSERLLTACMPALETHASVLGDLQEEFADRAKLSPTGARWWYRWQAAELSTFYLIARARHRPASSSYSARARRPDHMLLARSLRFAFRRLRQSPAFTVTAVLTLGLGIGANLAVFSVFSSVVLSPLPYDEPDQLVRLYAHWQDPTSHNYVTGPDVVRYGERLSSLDVASLYDYRSAGRDITGDGPPRRVRAMEVSSGYFSVLRASPLLGRAFSAGEEDGSARVTILSHALWKQLTGGDLDIIGRSITLDGEPHTIVGVMRPSFTDVTTEADIWLPLDLAPGGWNSPGNHYLSVVARLQPGVTIEQAQAELNAYHLDMAEAFPGTHSQLGGVIVPLFDEVVGQSTTMLYILMGASGLVLLVAVVNVANLFLSRALTRQREMAIRRALGSSPWRLMQESLAESGIVAAMGTVTALVTAWAGVSVLVAMSPESLPRAQDIGFDARLFAAAALVTITIGAVFGIAPSLQSKGRSLEETLRDAGRATTTGTAGQRIRRIMVGGQVALALMLLVGAGLLFKSFVRLQSVDPGFRSAGILTFEVHLPESKYTAGKQRAAFHEQLRTQLGALPGVQAVGSTSWLPLNGGYHSWGTSIVGTEEWRPAQVRVVDGEFFAALSIPLRDGRLFEANDGAESEAVAIVNESMARRLAPEGNAVGLRIIVGSGEWRVIGVVGDVAHDHRGAFGPKSYLAHTQYAGNRNWAMTYLMRTDREEADVLPLVARELAALDPDRVLYRPHMLEAVLARGIARDRFALTLMAIFAGLAALLAAIGIYGVLAYTVGQRAHEIGIRMALGANASHVRTMVMRQAAVVTGAGLLIGLGGAWSLSRVLGSLLYEVQTTDPLVFIAVPGALAALALLAGYIPTRRATAIDPAGALRADE